MRIISILKLALGSDVVSNISNCDPKDIAPVVTLLLIGFGKTGIIMIARIMGIDGDKGYMAQIRARTQFWFAGVLCFANDFIGKNMRDIVLVNGNERHGL